MANKVKGGYDAEFLTSMPHYECPICCLPFRNTVQTEECGHRYCKSCLDELITRSYGQLKCAICSNEVSNEKVFLDKAWQRDVLASKVKCKNEVRGCNWTGELLIFEEHLALCPFQIIPCYNEECKVKVQRGELEDHLKSQCQHRVVVCHYCKEDYIFRDEQVHKEVCKRLPLSCVNNCSTQSIPRDEISKMNTIKVKLVEERVVVLEKKPISPIIWEEYGDSKAEFKRYRKKFPGCRSHNAFRFWKANWCKDLPDYQYKRPRRQKKEENKEKQTVVVVSPLTPPPPPVVINYIFQAGSFPNSVHNNYRS